MCEESCNFPDEILFITFDYLNEYDLIHCEMVCRRWKNVILQLWKRLYRRKVRSCPQWQKYSQLRQIKADAPPIEFKKTCLAITVLNRNWRNGIFKKSCHYYEDTEEFSKKFTMSQNRLLFSTDSGISSFQILDKRTMNVINGPKVQVLCCHICDDTVMCGSAGYIDVFHANSGRLVNKIAEPNGWPVSSVVFGCCRLVAALSNNSGNSFYLTFWRMNSPLDIIHLRQLSFDLDIYSTLSMQMDDRYIAVYCEAQEKRKRKFWNVHFVSTKTLETETRMRFDTCKAHYAHGRVIAVKPIHYLQLIDVATGAWSQLVGYKFHHTPHYDEILIAINSSYVAVMAAYRSPETRIAIFDNQLSQTGTNVLLVQIEIPHFIAHFQMDDTQLVCVTGDDEKSIVVLDFAPSGSHGRKRATEIVARRTSPERMPTGTGGTP